MEPAPLETKRVSVSAGTASTAVSLWPHANVELYFVPDEVSTSALASAHFRIGDTASMSVATLNDPPLTEFLPRTRFSVGGAKRYVRFIAAGSAGDVFVSKLEVA